MVSLAMPREGSFITAITNDQTMKTIATRVEAYQKKRALPPPCEVTRDAIDVEVVDAEQEDNAELRIEDDTPTGGAGE
jgi:hypothetical protein